MKLGIYTTDLVIGESVVNFENVRESLQQDYLDSPESSYWKKRVRNNFKKIDSYRSFNNRGSHRDHKRLCKNKSEFKRAKKWYGYDDRYMDYNAHTYENTGLIRHTPHRNKVYCPCCSKHKILFSDKSKADNFIKFNSDSIMKENGYAPIRSYYCSLCGGWHVTSLEEDHMKVIGEDLCLEENIVMNLKASKAINMCDTEYEQEQKTGTPQDVIDVLIKDIQLSFNNEMEKFYEAYSKMDLSSCKEIHSRMKHIFGECQLPYKEIETIKIRVLDAQVDIDKLSALLFNKEQEKRMLIWSIQQSFKKEYEKFKHAYALRKLSDCHYIYMKTAKVIYESGVNLPFMKAIKEKLNYMAECLENLVDLKYKSNTCVTNINKDVSIYLQAV